MKLVKVCKDGTVKKIEKILDAYDYFTELNIEKIEEDCEPIEAISIPDMKYEPFELINVELIGYGDIKLISDLDEFEFFVNGRKEVTIPPGVYILVKDGKYVGIEVVLKKGQRITF